MRKFVIALLALACCVSATAELWPLGQFMGLYGLEVADAPAAVPDFSFCRLSGDSGVWTIVYTDDGAVRVASDSGGDAYNVQSTYLDCVDLYDFDVLVYADDQHRLVYAAYTDRLQAAFSAWPDFVPTGHYKDKGAFVDAVDAALGLEVPDVAALLSDAQSVDGVTDKLAATLKRLDGYLHGSAVDRVTVNPNYGTADAGDYIGLVYLTYPDRGAPANDYSNLTVAALSVANMVKSDCPEIVEVCVFFELPGYGAQAKYQFAIDADGVHDEDILVPRVMIQ